MMLPVMTLSAVAAGVIQSVTGFGSAILLMLAAPFFFDMVSAAAVSSSISMGLGISLALRFRRHIQWELCALPALVYALCSVTAIRMVRGIDLDALTLAFGGFLMALSVYFFLFAPHISFPPNRKSGCLCAAVSGLTSGLFGIGGPLMAVYFVSASRDKESYIANIQCLFALTNIVSFVTRVTSGIYTPRLIPVTLLGLAGILLGQRLGLRILARMELKGMKQVVYAFVGLSGLLTILQQI